MLNKRILVLMFLLLFLPLVGCFPAPPNQAPIITSTPITTATIGMLYTYNVNATDPDDDSLAYSLSVKPSGMIINSVTGVIFWTPTSKGNYPVVVKISDGALYITQSFTIVVSELPPVNQAPIIYSTPITTATVGIAYIYDVEATDPDGDTLTYSLTTCPSNMNINSATGIIIWIPTSVQVGNNPVVVKASDGALSDIQSFTIKVSKPPAPPPVNHAPIITSIPGDTVIIGANYLYDVNATDPEGDVLTYSLTKKPDDMTIDPNTGLINWTPIEEQIGANAVIVKVSDGKKATTQSFMITVKAVEPDPEIELTGIVVDPKTMTLFVGESEAIKSVTATYEIKGFEVPIPLEGCTYDLVNETVITVSNVGLVKAVGEGTATITVEYKGKADEITVTVSEPVSKTITIRWLEDGLPFSPAGVEGEGWKNDPIPPDDHKPATLIQDVGGWYFADAYEYYNFLITPEAGLEGSIVISETGELTGYTTYLYTKRGGTIEFLTEDILVGQVEIITGEEVGTIVYENDAGATVILTGHDGTMVGTYTQWTYKFGTKEDVINEYQNAIRCEGFDDKWLVRYADYTAHGEVPTQ